LILQVKLYGWKLFIFANYFFILFILYFQFFHTSKFRNIVAEWLVLATMASVEHDGLRRCAFWPSGPDNNTNFVRGRIHPDQNRPFATARWVNALEMP
jgi:hypothetical protein